MNKTSLKNKIRIVDFILLALLCLVVYFVYDDRKHDIASHEHLDYIKQECMKN